MCRPCSGTGCCWGWTPRAHFPVVPGLGYWGADPSSQKHGVRNPQEHLNKNVCWQGLKANECVKGFWCVRFRGPMGPLALPTRPERWGTSPPLLFRKDWGPIGAVWTREINELPSDFGGSIGPKNLTLMIYPPAQKGGGRRPRSCSEGIGARLGPFGPPKSTISGPVFGDRSASVKDAGAPPGCPAGAPSRPARRYLGSGAAVSCQFRWFRVSGQISKWVSLSGPLHIRSHIGSSSLICHLAALFCCDDDGPPASRSFPPPLEGFAQGIVRRRRCGGRGGGRAFAGLDLDDSGKHSHTRGGIFRAAKPQQYCCRVKYVGVPLS